VRDSILEFLSASAIITLIGMELYHLKAPLVESFILIISTLLGVILLTQPIQKRLYKGTLLQIYFLTMFYYDLSLGLLTKSIILFVSGLVFLGVWFFVRETEEAAA